jgi:hypothetical protein
MCCGRANQIEVSTRVFGLGDRASPSVHIPDVVRDTRRLGDYAPLSRVGIGGVGAPGGLIDDDRADPTFDWDLLQNLKDVRAIPEIVRGDRSGLGGALAVTPSMTRSAHVSRSSIDARSVQFRFEPRRAEIGSHSPITSFWRSMVSNCRAVPGRATRDQLRSPWG